MRRDVGLLAIALVVVACSSPSPIVPLTERDCPEGAVVAGNAPPAGDQQRCELPGGIRHGKSRAWYPNGRLRYETEWRQGKRHGDFTFWHENGRKKSEGRDVDGIPEGKWISWAEDGTVLQERVFAAVPRRP